MKRFWISWWQGGEDFRPLNYPPNEHVLGWWCSGSRDSDGASSLCAVVAGLDESTAIGAILKDWPDMGEIRFNEEMESSFLPGDRFPLSDWMYPRFATTPEVTQ